jgi:NADH:ubiquinone oxidoreductase subunit 6 (subunit J)
MIDETDVAFTVISALTIVASIFSLETKKVVYGAVALAFTFVGLAGLFIILDATFVAMFQIIVNVGAVAVLILFTVMLVGEGRLFKEVRSPVSKVVGMIAAAVLALTLALSFISSQNSSSGPAIGVPDYLGIGSLLTSQFAFSLEILALVFATALLGSLTLAKLDKPQHQESSAA